MDGAPRDPVSSFQVTTLPPLMYATGPRTHDKYWACMGYDKLGEDCPYWTYQLRKADKHGKRAGIHSIHEIEIPPEGLSPSREFRPYLQGLERQDRPELIVYDFDLPDIAPL